MEVIYFTKKTRRDEVDGVSIFHHGKENCSSVFINNFIYVFGGISVSSGRINDLYKYDTKNFCWTKLKNTEVAPTPRSGQSMVCWNNKLWIYGGISTLILIGEGKFKGDYCTNIVSSARTSFGDVVCYDLKKGEFIRIPSKGMKPYYLIPVDRRNHISFGIYKVNMKFMVI